MPRTNMVRPQGDVNPYVVTKADVDSFSQAPAGHTEGHLTSEAARGLACLGLSWLVLPVLPCFGRPNQRQTFGTWKCFSSPSLLCNLIPRQNQLSSPGIAEYLAYSSIWNACAWKNFSGPKKCFSCPRLLCNLILRQNELAKPSPYEPLRTNPLRTWGCPRS